MTVSTVSIGDKQTVQDALDAYAALPDKAKDKLAAEKDLLDKLLAKIEKLEIDKAATDTVKGLIGLLSPTDDLTLEEKVQVVAARDAYNNLTADQKGLVDNLTVLRDAETKIESLLADEAASKEADNFKEEHKEVLENIIKKDPSDITEKEKQDILNVFDAYEDLSDLAQKKLNEEKKGLDSVLKVIIEIEENTTNVKNDINNLPKAEDITLDDKQDVKVAREAFDALPDREQQHLVDELNKLKEAEAIIIALEEVAGFSQDHGGALALTKENIETTDRDKIEAALSAYGALSNGAKTILADDKNKLEDLLLEIKILEKAEADAIANKAAADLVEKLITDLPFLENISLANKASIAETRDAYDILTPDQKDLVDNLATLVAAENKIKDLEKDKAKVEAVEDIIKALPPIDDITLTHQVEIEAARDAYNKLTNNQKDLLGTDYLDQLKATETALEVKKTEAQLEAEEQESALNKSINELQTLINEVKSLNENDYTEESWADLQEKITAAQTVLADDNANKEQVDAAKTALNDVKLALEEKSQAEKFIAELRELNAEVNAILKADDLKKAISNLPAGANVTAADFFKGVVDKYTHEVTITFSDGSIEAVTVTINVLDEVNDLKEIINEAKAIKLNDYTPASYNKLQAVLVDAQAVNNDINAKPYAIDKAIADLNDAIDALVKKANKDALNSAIQDVESRKELDYTPESWDRLDALMDSADDILNDPNATQAEVNKATAEIQVALNKLTERANKAALKTALADANSKDSNDYTPNSWAGLDDLIYEAETIIDNLNASQDEVNKAKTDLVNALNKLVEKADKSGLEDLLNDPEGLKQSDYTRESWNGYQDAKDKADIVISNGNASQAEVDAAKDALQAAKEALVKKGEDYKEMDEEDLQKLLGRVDNLDEDDYTEKSWSSFEEAKNKAEDVLKDETTTVNEIEEAYKDLEQAISGLEKTPEKEAEDKPDPEKPVDPKPDPGKPTDPKPPVDPVDPKPVDPVDPEDPTAPKDFQLNVLPNEGESEENEVNTDIRTPLPIEVATPISLKQILTNGDDKLATVTVNKETGAIDVTNLEAGETYYFAITTIVDGKELLIGKLTISKDKDGKVSVKEELIDPYGTVYNSKTNAVVGGANVKIYYADTERNRQKGLDIHGLVNLPLVSGFAPNDNANPQYSTYTLVWGDEVNDWGNYAWLVFAETDYYIVATKEGFEEYTSPVLSVEFDVIKHDIYMDPIESDVEAEEKLPKTGSKNYDFIAWMMVAVGLALLTRSRRRKEAQ